MGKTELAKNLRGEERTLVVDCQHAKHLDLRDFDLDVHSVVVLDDISGPEFVVNNKKLLQQHIDGAKLGQSLTQNLSYEVFLWRVPTIVTTNYWDTTKLDDEDADWVTKNCVVVNVTEPVFETTGAP